MTEQLHQKKDVLIDRYQVVKYLKEGGMQQVYLATDLALQRTVALKVPKNASAEKRFGRSAHLSARINHPNVAQTLDYFETAERDYLVEEFIDGENLGDVLDGNFFYLDPHLAAHVFHHIAKGLAASHHAGVFHRDLKPKNVMVSLDPSFSIVKITDFGIAKLAEEEMLPGLLAGGESITGSQTLVGALPYMAPELIESPKEAGLPADVWATGAILYQLLVGDVPFGKGLKAVTAIVEGKLPAPPGLFQRRRQYTPLCDELWKVIEACMVRAPKKRLTADQLVKMCSKLCYSNSSRKIGTISSFRDGTGNWGFISVDDASVFFHVGSYYGTQVEIGQRVNFSAFPGSPSPRAFPIVPMKE